MLCTLGGAALMAHRPDTRPSTARLAAGSQQLPPEAAAGTDASVHCSRARTIVAMPRPAHTLLARVAVAGLASLLSVTLPPALSHADDAQVTEEAPLLALENGAVVWDAAGSRYSARLLAELGDGFAEIHAEENVSGELDLDGLELLDGAYRAEVTKLASDGSEPSSATGSLEFTVTITTIDPVITTMRMNVYFPPGSAVIAGGSQARLSALLKRLSHEDPRLNVTVTVTGYVAATQLSARGAKLASRRARAVVSTMRKRCRYFEYRKVNGGTRSTQGQKGRVARVEVSMVMLGTRERHYTLSN